jgi:hypothetical protein
MVYAAIGKQIEAPLTKLSCTTALPYRTVVGISAMVYAAVGKRTKAPPP